MLDFALDNNTDLILLLFFFQLRNRFITVTGWPQPLQGNAFKTREWTSDPALGVWPAEFWPRTEKRVDLWTASPSSKPGEESWGCRWRGARCSTAAERRFGGEEKPRGGGRRKKWKELQAPFPVFECLHINTLCSCLDESTVGRKGDINSTASNS